MLEQAEPAEAAAPAGAISLNAGPAEVLQILDALPLLVAYVDATECYRFNNAAYEEWFGRSRGEIHGRSARDVLGEDAYRVVGTHMRAALDGETVTYEASVPYRDAGLREIRATYVPDRGADGAVRGFFAVVEDITERRRELQQALDDLARSDERHKMLADAVPALVVTTTTAGEIQDFNAAYAAFTGLTLAQAQDWQSHQIIHPDDLEHAMAVWGQALGSGQPMVNEMRLRRFDGAYRWHLVNGIPLRDHLGVIERWITVSVDIHARKEWEQERERWTEELERANAAKDEFLGLVSHELRTPLTTIFGNAQVLRRSAHLVSGEDRIAALADIEKEAERLQRIIDNMLALARVDAGTSLNVEPVLLPQLIHTLVEEHRLRHPARAVRLELPAGLGVATAERTYLELVLRNLLSNAEKYSPEGAEIALAATQDERRVSVTVRDACGGLDEGEEDAIFGVFYRSPRTAASAPGTGIGLAVCRRLIEAQGGTIVARSMPGEGCEMSFTLPAIVEPED